LQTSLSLLSALCPEGWVEGLPPEKCYLFGTTAMSWTSCSYTCEGLGASMLCVEDDAESRFISEHSANDTGMWLGISDSEEEGSWVWPSGCLSVYHDWHDVEPSNSYGREDCAVAGAAGSRQAWTTYDCTQPTEVCGCESVMTVSPSRMLAAGTRGEDSITEYTI